MTSKKMTNYDTLPRQSSFESKFLGLFTLDPIGTEWVSLGDVLNVIQYRSDFGYQASYMVLWIREICVAAGLIREDRTSGPGHIDLSEGYYGILRKE